MVKEQREILPWMTTEKEQLAFWCLSIESHNGSTSLQECWEVAGLSVPWRGIGGAPVSHLFWLSFICEQGKVGFNGPWQWPTKSFLPLTAIQGQEGQVISGRNDNAGPLIVKSKVDDVGQWRLLLCYYGCRGFDHNPLLNSQIKLDV